MYRSHHHKRILVVIFSLLLGVVLFVLTLDSKFFKQISTAETYSSPEYGFSIDIPLGFTMSTKPEAAQYYDYNITKVLDLLGPKDPQIDRAEVTVAADTGTDALAHCLSDDNSGGRDTLTKTKTINGVSWYVAEDKADDSAMGGARGQISDLRTIYNQTCYRIMSGVYWHAVGYAGYINTGTNSATDAEKKAQTDAITKYENAVGQIIDSFTFNK